MCDCMKAALNKEFVIRNSIYDEEKHDFIDTDYYIPLYKENKKGQPTMCQFIIKCCPICGERIEA